MASRRSTMRMWPTCTPSKFPMETTPPRKRSGSSSKWRKRTGIGSIARIAYYRLHHLGIAVDGQHDRSLLGAVAAVGDYGQHVAAIGQAEADGEAAIGPQANRLAAECDPGIRM